MSSTGGALAARTKRPLDSSDSGGETPPDSSAIEAEAHEWFARETETVSSDPVADEGAELAGAGTRRIGAPTSGEIGEQARSLIDGEGWRSPG